MTRKTNQQIIDKALSILEERLAYKSANKGESMTSPEATRAFLKLKLAEKESESFCVMFLDTRHRLLSFDEMFKGTIDGAAVYPREVVKAALQYNAAAVIFAHNHPSGEPKPSRADEQLTQRLKSALELVDVRTLDHLIVGEGEPVSFAERGLL